MLLEIVMYNGERRYCEYHTEESEQAASDDEILYYALQLLRNSGRKRLSLHLQGNCSQALKKQLKRTFSPLLCE